MDNTTQLNNISFGLINSLLNHKKNLTELKDNYLQVLCILDRIEMTSSLGLITSDLVMSEEKTKLPDAFIKTYLYIKTLYRTVEIAKELNETSDIEILEEKITLSKNALRTVYFNKSNSDYSSDSMYANELASDIGIYEC